MLATDTLVSHARQLYSECALDVFIFAKALRCLADVLETWRVRRTRGDTKIFRSPEKSRSKSGMWKNNVGEGKFLRRCSTNRNSAKSAEMILAEEEMSRWQGRQENLRSRALKVLKRFWNWKGFLALALTKISLKPLHNTTALIKDRNSKNHQNSVKTTFIVYFVCLIILP